MGFVQLLSTCIDKLHLGNLVDACAEFVRTEAYSVTVKAFEKYALLGVLLAVGIIGFGAFCTAVIYDNK